MVVPWLRMVRRTLALIGKPRIDLLSVSRVRIRISPNDLDTNLHVNNGRYLTLADLGRYDWFVRTGVWEAAKRHGVYPVVGDSIAKYRRELRAFEAVDIESHLVGWSGRWAFIEHRFVRLGRVVAMVGIRGAFRGPNGTVESWDFLSELMKDAAGNLRASPLLPDWTRAFYESAEAFSTQLRSEERARGL